MLRRAASGLWRFRDSRAGYIALWTLVMVFLGRAAVNAYQDYAGVPPFSVTAFSLGIAAVVVHAAALPVKWHYLLQAEGADLGFLKTGKIFYLSQLSSYIPGGVWQYLEMGYRAAADGTDMNDVAHSVAYLNGVTVTAALFYALIAAAITVPGYRAAAGGGAVAMLAVTIWSADIVERLKGELSGWIELPAYHPSRRTLATLFAVSLALWGVAGASVFFLTDAFTRVTLAQFPAISGAFAFAWAAGFLVLVVPGGLGIREGTLIYLLTTFVPRPAVLAVAVTARVLMMAGEVAMAAGYTVAARWLEP